VSGVDHSGAEIAHDLIAGGARRFAPLVRTPASKSCPAGDRGIGALLGMLSGTWVPPNWGVIRSTKTQGKRSNPGSGRPRGCRGPRTCVRSSFMRRQVHDADLDVGIVRRSRRPVGTRRGRGRRGRLRGRRGAPGRRLSRIQPDAVSPRPAFPVAGLDGPRGHLDWAAARPAAEDDGEPVTGRDLFVGFTPDAWSHCGEAAIAARRWPEGVAAARHARAPSRAPPGPGRLAYAAQLRGRVQGPVYGFAVEPTILERPTRNESHAKRSASRSTSFACPITTCACGSGSRSTRPLLSAGGPRPSIMLPAPLRVPSRRAGRARCARRVYHDPASSPDMSTGGVGVSSFPRRGS